MTDTGQVWGKDPTVLEGAPLAHFVCPVYTGMPMPGRPKCHTMPSPALSEVPAFPLSTPPNQYGSSYGASVARKEIYPPPSDVQQDPQGEGAPTYKVADCEPG